MPLSPKTTRHYKLSSLSLLLSLFLCARNKSVRRQQQNALSLKKISTVLNTHFEFRVLLLL